MPYIGNTPALDYISFAVQNFTVTAGTTVYTLDYSVSNENDIALYINSVAQRPGVSFAYSATGTTLTLTSATLATDTMYAVFIGRAVQTVTPPANINLQLADGTAAAPSLNFANDTNTGIFRPAADTIGFAEGGTEALRINSDAQTVHPLGTALLPSMTFTGDVNTGIFSPTADTIAFTEGGAEAMRIDSSGQVGIGTTSPDAPLDIRATNSSIRLGNASQYFRIQHNDSANALVFNDNDSAERMRISSGGSVMINTTTNDLGKLNVSGSIYLFDLGSGAGSSTLKYDHLSSGRVTFDTSSRLVKENIENSPYGLNEILQLQPRKYFRKDDQRNEIGLIADEVVDILPEFVPIGQKKLITENKEDVELIPVGVNYEKLTAVLIKGIQELSVKNDVLEARLTVLENK